MIMRRWAALNPEIYADRVIGNGHCVVFVRQATDLPSTPRWRRGVKARGAALLTGTTIATFDMRDRYANATDGSSHAAVLIKETPDGLLVWDQWEGHPVSRRTIRWKAGAGMAADDGDQFHAIETADEEA